MKAIGVFFICFTIWKLTFTSEQYRTSLISLKLCEHTELPYGTGNRSFDVFFKTYNNSRGVTLFGGYIKVNTEVTDTELKAALSYGYETPHGMYWMYKIKDQGCSSLLAKILFKVLGVPFIKKCKLVPGQYPINKIDVDKIDQALQGPMARKYGIYMAIISVYSHTHTLTCWEARLNVQPVKTKNGKH